MNLQFDRVPTAKKFIKPDPVKNAIYSAPPVLKGSIFFYGKIGCLHEDTEIYIEENNRIVRRQIKDLSEKFNVVSYNFEGEKRNKEVVTEASKVYSGEQEVYEIEFYNGKKVYATKNHVFFDNKGEEIKVKDIKTGFNLFGRGIKLKNLNVMNRLSVRKTMSKAKSGKNHHFYGKKMSLQTREKMRISHLGDRNIMHNPEIRKRHKEAMQNPELLKLWSNNAKGNKNPSFGKIRYPKARFVDNLNHRVRSSWEENICNILKNNNIKYSYEPERFVIQSGDRQLTYTPDIKLNDNIYLEIKGAIFDWQLDKMNKFIEQYPDKRLIIITSKKNLKYLSRYKFEILIYEDFDTKGIIEVRK